MSLTSPVFNCYATLRQSYLDGAVGREMNQRLQGEGVSLCLSLSLLLHLKLNFQIFPRKHALAGGMSASPTNKHPPPANPGFAA